MNFEIRFFANESSTVFTAEAAVAAGEIQSLIKRNMIEHWSAIVKRPFALNKTHDILQFARQNDVTGPHGEYRSNHSRFGWLQHLALTQLPMKTKF